MKSKHSIKVKLEMVAEYKEAKEDVLTCKKALEWSRLYCLDKSVINDRQEFLEDSIEDFKRVCRKMEEIGITMEDLILIEMGVKSWD